MKIFKNKEVSFKNMDGLIIKSKWLNLILKGEKTIEIRGSDTKKQGEIIYLLESETNRVLGTCKIAYTYTISCSDWSEERDNHKVELSYPELKKIYKNPYAWVLEDVKPIKSEKELYYKHPKGAVIWVKDVEKYIL